MVARHRHWVTADEPLLSRGCHGAASASSPASLTAMSLSAVWIRQFFFGGEEFLRGGGVHQSEGARRPRKGQNHV